jgi:hypothetical protein
MPFHIEHRSTELTVHDTSYTVLVMNQQNENQNENIWGCNIYIPTSNRRPLFVTNQTF